MHHPAPRLLVFDLDGTLIDSSLDLCNSVNAMLVHLGRPALPHAVIASYIGDGAAMLVRRALGDPGVLDALQEIRLRAPGLPMAVLTNKPVGPSRGICDALGVTPFLFQNYGGDSFATKKPDPTGLRTLMLEAQGLLAGDPAILASEVVMVGDSDVDVLTARNCGARAVGCAFGLSPHMLAVAQPDATVQDASEWPDALLGPAV